VTDIESITLRSDSRSRRDSVVFPAPDGEDNTNISPRRAIIGVSERFLAISVSLQVLHLLAELLDHAFEFKANVRELKIVGLGSQRI
jgi:hypothetical protein